jgi:hypothetical protein
MSEHPASRVAGTVDLVSTDLSAHDHVVWCGDGGVDFARLAQHAIATAPADELVLLVAHLDALDFDPAEQFAGELEHGRLVLVEAGEAYRPMIDGRAGFDADQLREFEGVLTDALTAGFSGIRVIADNTVMLTGSVDVEERWLAWEQLTDRWQARHPVTGICFFDRTRIPADRLQRIAAVHPLSAGVAASGPHVYHDTGVPAVVLDGSVDAGDVDELQARLRTELALPDVASPLVVDVGRVSYLHHSVLRALDSLGVPVLLRNTPRIVRRLVEFVPDLQHVLVG